MPITLYSERNPNKWWSNVCINAFNDAQNCTSKYDHLTYSNEKVTEFMTRTDECKTMDVEAIGSSYRLNQVLSSLQW